MTKFTDYGLRVLVALAVSKKRVLGASEIAQQYGLSQHHIAKIATALVAGGFVVSERGRNGGLRLAESADAISLGAVVRHLSKDDTLVECLSCTANQCRITQGCGLIEPLRQAREAFYSALDPVTIADCTVQRDLLRGLLAS